MIALPAAFDENAERRKYLEEQEREFEAKKQEEQRKLKEDRENKIKVFFSHFISFHFFFFLLIFSSAG